MLVALVLHVVIAELFMLSQTAYLGDFWRYDPSVLEWTMLGLDSATKAIAPRPRYGHGLTSVTGRLYLFGGFGDSGPVIVSWRLGCMNVHTQPRPCMQCCLEISSSVLIFFYEKLQWISRSLLPDTNSIAGYVNELWTYNPEESAWALLDPLGESPASRAHHSFHSSGSFLVLFGGTVNSQVNSALYEGERLSTLHTPRTQDLNLLCPRNSG
jgi:hypothetical protein